MIVTATFPPFSNPSFNSRHAYSKVQVTLPPGPIQVAIQFDPAKTELIHFTTGAAAPSAALTLPDLTVVKPKKVVKWLGILFDDALSFKQHVSSRAGQATSAFFRMCRLATTVYGLRRQRSQLWLAHLLERTSVH